MRTAWALFIVIFGIAGAIGTSILLVVAVYTHGLHVEAVHWPITADPAMGPKFSEGTIHGAPIVLAAMVAGSLFLISVGISRCLGREQSPRRRLATLLLASAVPALLFAFGTNSSLQRWEQATELHTGIREHYEGTTSPDDPMFLSIEDGLRVAAECHDRWSWRYHAFLLAAGVLVVAGGGLRYRDAQRRA